MQDLHLTALKYIFFKKGGGGRDFWKRFVSGLVASHLYLTLLPPTSSRVLNFFKLHSFKHVSCTWTPLRSRSDLTILLVLSMLVWLFFFFFSLCGFSLIFHYYIFFQMRFGTVKRFDTLRITLSLISDITFAFFSVF